MDRGLAAIGPRRKTGVSQRSTGSPVAVRHEFPARRVEAKDEDPVKPLVGHSDEPAARIKHSVVRMRACLLLRRSSGPSIGVGATKRSAGNV